MYTISAFDDWSARLIHPPLCRIWRHGGYIYIYMEWLNREIVQIIHVWEKERGGKKTVPPLFGPCLFSLEYRHRYNGNVTIRRIMDESGASRIIRGKMRIEWERVVRGGRERERRTAACCLHSIMKRGDRWIYIESRPPPLLLSTLGWLRGRNQEEE